MLCQKSAWWNGWRNGCGAMVVGSAAIATPAGAVNRFLLVQPDGATYRYDKRHLFRMADEHRHYQAGQERVVVAWRGGRILPQVCYGLRFPLWSRNQHNYSGNSLIIDPQGTVMAQADPGAAACLQARLSLATLGQYRETFPAWRDADRFSLKP